MSMICKYSIYFFQDKTKVELTQTMDGGYVFTKTDETDYTFIRKYPELKHIEDALEQDGSIKLSYSEVMSLTFTLLGMTYDVSTGGGSMMSMFGSSMTIFYEMINNPTLIKDQYNLVGENSKFPENPDEALLVLDKNNEVDEYVLYALGILTEQDMNDILKAKVKGQTLKPNINYDDIIGTTYKILNQSDYFVEIDGKVVDIRTFSDTKSENFDMMKYMTYYAQVLSSCTNTVKISGIVRLKDHVDTGSLSTGVAYLNELTNSMIDYYNNSIAVDNSKLEELSLETPSSINIYVNSFESKEVIQNFIEKYNSQSEKEDQIKYTDLVGTIMSTVSIIINSITYVLIAFVSVSLVVSSIMIGIITYISVIERTKEIGVLRSIGASKKDIKRVFTSESFIIGLTSGVFGILVTLLLTIPINLVLIALTGISGLASLPIVGAISLILISVFLTFIAGLIPAKIASKKDPVIALRTE